MGKSSIIGANRGNVCILMFRGTAIVKSDAKGRIVIPNCFRTGLLEQQEQEQEDLVITGNPYGYLMLMFRSKYEKLERKVKDRPDSSLSAIYFKQCIIGLAEDDFIIDKAGRIPLSPGLREHAKINGKVSLLGMFDSINVWSTDQLDKLREKIREEKAPEGWSDFST